MSLVTVTTDFGGADPYVAALKGVILSQVPSARIVDVCHEVPPFDVAAGRRTLEAVVDYYPKGTIHLAVVDPGVGTSRAPIAVEHRGQVFVGPDNGLFGFALADPRSRFWTIRSSAGGGRPVSPTFHGRDLFAPFVAGLLRGRRLESLALRRPRIADLSLPAPRRKGTAWVGQVVSVDRFGNLLTNLTQKWCGRWGNVRFGRRRIGPVRHSYGDVGKGKPLALWGSRGQLEIAVREGNAAVELGGRIGSRVSVETKGLFRQRA